MWQPPALEGRRPGHHLLPPWLMDHSSPRTTSFRACTLLPQALHTHWDPRRAGTTLICHCCTVAPPRVSLQDEAKFPPQTVTTSSPTLSLPRC